MNDATTQRVDDVRKLLDQEVDYSAVNQSASDTFGSLLDAARTDIPYRDLVSQTGNEGVVTLKGKMAIGAWFQAIEDSHPNLCIVVRDYGLLMTRKERVPKGAISASELWKLKEAKKDEPKAIEKK